MQPLPNPVTDRVGALLDSLVGQPVTEHAAVFADVHAVLQDALADAGRTPDRR
jgi:hypothetical protein